MDSITHNGAEYLKASILAKRYRYTTDYIGQLCRQNKVDAQLVGRAWYVSEESLLKYKVEKKKEVRPTEILSRNKLEVTSADGAERIAVHSGLSKKTHRQFFSADTPGNSHHWQNRSQQYSADNSSLVPAMANKPVITSFDDSLGGNITPVPLHSPEAGKIVVKTSPEERKSSLHFTDLPEVSLRGDLAVLSLDTESDYSYSEPVELADLPHPAAPLARAGVTLRYHKTPQRQSLPQELEMTEKTEKTEDASPAAISQPASPVSRRAPLTRPESEPGQYWVVRLILPGMVVASVAIASFCIAVSRTIVVSDGVVQESFSFDKTVLSAARALVSGNH